MCGIRYLYNIGLGIQTMNPLYKKKVSIFFFISDCKPWEQLKIYNKVWALKETDIAFVLYSLHIYKMWNDSDRFNRLHQRKIILANLYHSTVSHTKIYTIYNNKQTHSKDHSNKYLKRLPKCVAQVFATLVLLLWNLRKGLLYYKISHNR